MNTNGHEKPRLVLKNEQYQIVRSLSKIRRHPTRTGLRMSGKKSRDAEGRSPNHGEKSNDPLRRSPRRLMNRKTRVVEERSPKGFNVNSPGCNPGLRIKQYIQPRRG